MQAKTQDSTQQDKTASNSVSLDENGIIRLLYKGAQTQKTLRTITDQLFELMSQQRLAGKKVYVLADMRGIHKADSSARLEAKWFLEEADYDALAVVGNRYLQPFIFFVLRDFKNRKSVNYFTRTQPATEWLLGSSHQANTKQLKLRNRLKWVIVPLIVLTALATITSWRQYLSRIESEAEKNFATAIQTSEDSINDRLRVYYDALHGFRGLFHASEEINEREYTSYFNSLDLQKNYPGFNSIDYVSTVSDSDKQAFIEKIKTDNSLLPSGNPNFAITPDTNMPEHFVVTFVGIPNASGGKGVNIAVDNVRRQALESARDSGQLTATDTVYLLDQQGKEQSKSGFLLTMPIYLTDVPATVEGRQAANRGFVNAIFDYNNLFDHITSTFNTDIALQVTDSDGDVVYKKGNAPQDSLKSSVNIDIAGGRWTLEMQAPKLFGISQNEARIPGLVLSSGTLLTITLSIIFWIQNRSRQRAIDLASNMTEDIRHERNNAIATKNRLEAILSSIGDAVVVLDSQGRIVLFNKAVEEISGFTSSEAVGKAYEQVLNFYNNKDGSAVADFVQAAMAGKRSSMAANTMLRRKDGSSRPIADSAAPVKDAEGKLVGIVIVFRDITHEKQVEHMKDEFLSIASHELRTPMGAIRAMASMILSGDYGPVNKELVEPLTDIRASTIRLVELVNDLLDVTRIEAGRMKFTLSNFDIQQVAKATATSLAPLSKEKGLQIVFSPGEPATVQADADKVKQVLTNLVGNSLKFTETGSITIATTTHNDSVEITVTDTGAGISNEDQSKLFGRFQQIVSRQDGKPAGTGLGLYISREIVRKMGGELWIKNSATGKGSTFAFTLPLPQSRAGQEAKKALLAEASQHPDQK